MKTHILFAFHVLISINGLAQNSSDTIIERLITTEDRLNSIDERVSLNETDLGKLTKLKVSGYLQAQFENYQDGLLKPNDPANTFFIRRARVKFSYEAADGLKFVLQPDFSTGNLSLKDAYAVASHPKLPWLALWAGQFNRPNYEVEYSSGQREVLERSRVIRTIYPGEREIGAKIEATPLSFPLKLQLAVLNGNFTGKEPKDADSRKDIMGRAVYSLSIPGGIGIDLGAHLYSGGVQSKNKFISDYNNVLDSTDSNTGSYLDKNWFGGEIQVFYDLLGGIALKGEYIAGKNASLGDSKLNPSKTRNFSGYYAYLIKNIGKRNQLVARYDVYDPNTKRSGDDAGKEVNYKTLTLAWQFYLNDNIRFSVNYEMPNNETNSTVPEDIKDNVFGVRMQAKF